VLAVSDRGAPGKWTPRPEQVLFDTLLQIEQRGVPGEGRIACRDELLLLLWNAGAHVPAANGTSSLADKYASENRLAAYDGPEPNSAKTPTLERCSKPSAFLACARALRSSDEFPEITEALLSIHLPAFHPARALPLTIADFRVQPRRRGRSAGGLKDSSRFDAVLPAVWAGVPCKFRTCYDTYVWPLSVVAPEMEDAGPASARHQGSGSRGGGVGASN